jgi:hypothetical protein
MLKRFIKRPDSVIELWRPRLLNDLKRSLS